MAVTPSRREPRAGWIHRNRRWSSAVAGAVIVALVITIAIVALGYDARETPREESALWVTRSDAAQYGRFNTQTGEIDTVRSVDDPSDLLQTQDASVMLTQDHALAWTVDPSNPEDLRTRADRDDPAATSASEQHKANAVPTVGTLDSSAAAATGHPTPSGTVDVLVQGNWAVTRTQDGSAFTARVGNDPAAAITGGEAIVLDGEPYPVTAAALTPRGRAALYSAPRGEVRFYDLGARAFRGSADTAPPGLTAAQLALVGNSWVLFDPVTGTVHRDGRAPVEVPGAADLGLDPTRDANGDAAGGADGDAAVNASDAEAGESPGPVGMAPERATRAQLQGSTDIEGDPVVATTTGLWEITDSAEHIAEARGRPAQPQHLNGSIVAAWAGDASAGTGGVFWHSEAPDRTVPLEFDAAVEDLTDPRLVLRSNGSRAVLNEVRTGMLWTLPDGEAIPLDQWGLLDPPEDERGETAVDDATEPEPPVAGDDAFGVRPGQSAPVPVLLNDADPNRRDVLTIDPGSVTVLDPGFGTLQLLPDRQGFTVTPTAEASGSASFQYRVTDGTLTSDPATVTLTAVSDDTHSAPEWCGVEGCQRDWPAPEITPGGTLLLPILDGWVDPEGDPMALTAVSTTDSGLRAIITNDGAIAVRDTGGTERDAVLTVALSDSNGEHTQRDLSLTVSRAAQMQMEGLARTVSVGQPTQLDPLSRVTGGSGSATIERASSSDFAVTVRGNSVDLTAAAPGSGVIHVTVRDTVTDAQLTGLIRVTAVDTALDPQLPLLRAYVRPLTDTTFDVLASLPGSLRNTAAITSVTPEPDTGAELHADVVDHHLVRIAGTAGGAGGDAGFIGAVRVTAQASPDASAVPSAGGLETDAAIVHGTIHVFAAPESTGLTAIAAADVATVRAGSVVDIAVLDNDVAPPGQRLVLHPSITGSDTEGELAFASGNTLRYLAPAQPGTYTVTYRVYGDAAPESSDTAQVRVTVLPASGNAAPTPTPLTVRVAAGARARVSVPVTGVDPDGDRVRVTSVEQPASAGLTLEARDGITAIAERGAAPGVHTLQYTVRDPGGATGSARLTVVVTPGQTGTPVVYHDVVRVAPDSAPVQIRPLDNDLDPAGGTLRVTEVSPNLPGGEEHPDAPEATRRLDTADLRSGIVRIRPGTAAGTMVYRYSVVSSATGSTADGLIVVHTTNRIGAAAPVAEDTVLSVTDRELFERRGVDVVTERVRWATGDPAALRVSLWNNRADGYSVSGQRIRGSYRADGDLVPYRLAGTDATGRRVDTYALLIVPALDDLRLSLAPGFSGLRVREGQAVSERLDRIIPVGARDTLEFAGSRLPVSRSAASCTIDGDSIVYRAGAGEPWQDRCVVQARITGQRQYTELHIPVTVEPNEPVAVLGALTRTVPPGERTTLALTEMLRWEGDRAGDTAALRWSGEGTRMVSVSGDTATITVPAGATPGSTHTATIRVRGSGDSTAPLTIRVGQAPAAAPRGGTVRLSCDVGSPCSAPAVGIDGEFDPFAGRPGAGLTVTRVDPGSCAPLGTFRVQNGSSIALSWASASASGSECAAQFTVRDAQGRTGTGTIELDARGVPRAPLGITQVAYTGTSVTLQIQPSPENAYPAVSGYVVTRDGREVGACTLDGRCTVTGLTNGERHTYVAHALNAVGRSDASPGVTAWAYDAPPAPRITARQLPGSTNVEVTLRGASGTRGYELSLDNDRVVELTGRDAKHVYEQLPAGSHTVTAVSLSQFTPPAGGAPANGQASATVRVHPAPTDVTLALETRGTELWATVTAQSASPVQVGVMDNGVCRVQPESTFRVPGATRQFVYIEVTGCATNTWGTSMSPPSGAYLGDGHVPPPSGLQVRYAPELSLSLGSEIWQAPITVHAAAGPGNLRFSTAPAGPWTREVPQPRAGQQLTALFVQRCIDIDGAPAGTQACSEPTQVAAETPPRLDRAFPSCVDGDPATALRRHVLAPWTDRVTIRAAGADVWFEWPTGTTATATLPACAEGSSP